MSYFVYILTNKSDTLYAGMTNNIERRLLEHFLKIPNAFTTKYNINKLIYLEEFQNVNDAISAEKKIKGWSRSKKMKLIKSINPNFTDLLKGN